jgi:hypothetical protein
MSGEVITSFSRFSKTSFKVLITYSRARACTTHTCPPRPSFPPARSMPPTNPKRIQRLGISSLSADPTYTCNLAMADITSGCGVYCYTIDWFQCSNENSVSKRYLVANPTGGGISIIRWGWRLGAKRVAAHQPQCFYENSHARDACRDEMILSVSMPALSIGWLRRVVGGGGRKKRLRVPKRSQGKK